ncbi:putative Ig domain-containing protein [Gimesia aquarii]|uniref:Calx-beta domain protein n=1 Tax=Gimesia aquarii TaxID=2527964 RepID=A0A517WY19_9PLAN|nr:putative Ig domain-containing protein [Gimesia aquarii]QDU10151.1 Calx-beta domain protein [Gimesia aquarii]
MLFDRFSNFYQYFVLLFCRNFRKQFEKRPKRSRGRRSFAPTHSIAQIEILEDRQLLAADDLTDLNDDFDNAASIANWQRINQTEGWNADQLETWDINQTQAGRMVLAPYTTSWFESYRGPLVFKEITGDFVITTQVNISDRDDIGDSDLNDIPNGSTFSLAGLMIRTPRDIQNPAVDWTPGSFADDGTNNGENYIFLSLGFGNSGNQFQMETKTTRNSNSSLVLQDRGDNSVINLQIARIGENVFTLYQVPGEDWVLDNRYHRPDMPETLQAGMVAYSDWGKVSDYDPFDHNNNVLQPGGFDPTPFEAFEPDIVAGFEYIQFDRPEVPEYLQGIDLRTQTTNLQMLSFLGDNVNSPVIPNQDTAPPMQVGMNLEGIADWSSAWTFTDMAHTMRTWNSVALNLTTFQSQWGSTLFDIELDEHGWPTQTHQTVNEAGQTIIQQFVAPILTGDVNPAGIYRAEWDGEATVLLPGVIEQGTTSEGRHYALLDLVENQDILLTIRDIDPTNHFRNFNLWMPDYNGQSFVGQDWQPGDDFSPFHPLFLERLAPFDTLRFMDWMETNETDVVTWEDRARLEDATYHGGNDPNDFHNGIAPEYMIELSNTLNANAWFNMPHQANDDFVRNFAEMVRDNLDPELTIYVEWSNEIWNYAYGFHASFWIQDQLALPENAGINWYEFAASQIQQDFAIWQEVFAGQEDRIVRVVAGQQSNPAVLAGLLPAMNGNFDAISVTGYAGLGFEQLASFDESTTVDDVIDTVLEETILWSLSRLIDHQNLADQYSQILGREIDLVTYEGGSHPDAYGWPVQEVVHAASRSPRMSEIYQALLNGADLIGVDLFNQFTFTGGGFSAPWGDWGLLHTMDQPLETSFEYQTIVDFINSQTPEVLPVVNIESTVSSVDESGEEQLVYTLTRSDDQIDAPLTVGYQVSGTATSGSDFVSLTGEVTFNANESSVTILVTVLEDLQDENEETIQIQLLDQNTYHLGDLIQASGSIIDNDFTNIAPVVSPIPDQIIAEEETFSLFVNSYVSDVNSTDGDQIILTAMLADGAGLPDWLEFHSQTGELIGTPNLGSAGIFEIEISAIDLAGLESSTTFQLTVTPVPVTQYEMRVVNTPTTTTANGEVANLPPIETVLTEWQSYWIEVWASVPNSSDHGIESYSFNLHYNSNFTTASNIEYGPAFLEEQSGQIDDETGTIQSISARTSLTDVGDDQFVLLARIQFTSTANDQVNLDLESPGIGPYQAEFLIEQANLQLTDQAESQMEAINLAKVEFWAIPYDANDDDMINFRDLMLFASTYGSNVSNSNSPFAWFMDYNQSGTVNFRDLIFLAENYGKSKFNNSHVTFPSGFPDTWAPQSLIMDIAHPVQPQMEITSMTIEEVNSTAHEAVQIYSESASLSERSRPNNTKFEIADITENTLATAMPGRIVFDISVGGYGWFVYNSPWDHSEFNVANSYELEAFTNSKVSLPIDLLTVIFHDLKHLLEHQHETSGLMHARLSPGIRRLPDEIPHAATHFNEDHLHESDQFFSSLKDNDLQAFG